MLKWIYINDKKIPIPVPLKTLGQAVVWVDKTLVPQGHSITRVNLDGTAWSDEHPRRGLSHDSELSDKSRLEVRIDSPTDLAIQTISAIRNLSEVVESGLKALAVECWQAKAKDHPGELANVENDSLLLIDLTQHLQGLLDGGALDIQGLIDASEEIRKVSLAVSVAKSQSDWRGCARLLLNRMEPELRKMIGIADEIHFKLLSYRQTPPTSPNTGAKTG